VRLAGAKLPGAAIGSRSRRVSVSNPATTFEWPMQFETGNQNGLEWHTRSVGSPPHRGTNLRNGPRHSARDRNHRHHHHTVLDLCCTNETTCPQCGRPATHKGVRRRSAALPLFAWRHARTVRACGSLGIQRGFTSNQLMDPQAVTARRAAPPIAPKKRVAAPPDIQVGGTSRSVLRTDRNPVPNAYPGRRPPCPTEQRKSPASPRPRPRYVVRSKHLTQVHQISPIRSLTRIIHE